ncbi:MAG: hypothetical protein HYY25_00520 [Candidatus Wallbacteria bacterium]|nr:hypothetical protein [Candidatus Wallbacteria bacterium]
MRAHTAALNERYHFGMSVKGHLSPAFALAAAASIAIAALQLSVVSVHSLLAPISLLMLGYCAHLELTYPEVKRPGWNWLLLGVNVMALGALLGALGRIPVHLGSGGALTAELMRWLEAEVAIPAGVTMLAFGAARWVPAFVGRKDGMRACTDRMLESMERLRQALAKAERRGQAAEDRALDADAERRREIDALVTRVRRTAHELSNPLAVIAGYVELLEADPFPEETKEILRHVYQSAFRCKDVVAQLVELAAEHQRAAAAGAILREPQPEDAEQR